MTQRTSGDARALRLRRPRRGGDLAPLERFARLLLLFALLFAFLAAIDLLGTGLGGLGQGFTDALFQGIGNPLLGLFVGIFATVLVQSSSVTTATLVTLVGTGVIGLGDAVPIVMGANIGTTITNTLASIGSIRRAEEFRRTFTGATMHDVFNVLTVAVLLPLELLTGLLSRGAIAISSLVSGVTTGEFRSPAKALVSAATEGLESLVRLALTDDRAVAAALVVIGFATIFAALVGITRTMKRVVAGPAERSLNAVLGRAGSLGILVGLVLTVAVQSSSISTSLLIPMIAAGVLSVEAAYPITLGANLGTTVTALLAALAVDRVEGLQIALVHLLFNVAGVLLFYPVPALRRLPLRAAARFGALAVRRRLAVVVLVVMAFYVVPLIGILVLR